jgi:hypothetical protein
MERSLDQNLSRVSRRSSSAEKPRAVEPEYARQGDGANSHTPVDSAPSASNPRVTYRPHSDATPEGELFALAAVYAFVLKCHEHKQMAAEISDSEHETIERR